MKNNRKFGDDEVRARAVPREKVDLKKLSRALIAMAMAQAQAEADAEAEHNARDNREKPRAA